MHCVQVSSKLALLSKCQCTGGAFKVSKGRLLQFRSPGHLLNRSLPLVGLTSAPIYSSFMSYRYVGSKVSLNRETLLTMGATEGCEWFILFSLPSLPLLTFQPEIWHSVTLCSLDSFFAVRLPHLTVSSLILPFCVVNLCFVEVSFVKVYQQNIRRSLQITVVSNKIKS